MSAKKNILDNRLLEAEFFEDVMLTGIVCPYEPYRFAWAVASHLPYPFENDPMQTICVQDEPFAVYTWVDECRLIEHFLIANRHKTSFLLPEIRHIDFLWMCKGNIRYQPDLDALSGRLRDIPGVVTTFPIDPDLLPNREHLIL